MTLIYERLKGYFVRVSHIKRIASFAFVSVMFPLSILATGNSTFVTESEPIQSNIVLDTKTASALSYGKSVTEIKPGESKVEREAREAREAAQKVAILKRTTVVREKRVYADPSNFGEIYVRAQNATGVDARILQAIHQVETGCSGSSSITNHTGSGATGPMQFMPSTWRRHGIDGNGDGYADINNVEDAIFSAATYLKACGYPNVKKALWGYNPSSSYYYKVMGIAGSLGYQ